jgi:outer membrane immunogenic protein
MRICKTSFLAASILSALAALTSIRTADAADLPTYRPPAQVAPASYNWSGFYIGGHLGYGWGEHDITPTGKIGLMVPPFSVDHDGFIGGVTAGWNYQYGRIVLGVEGEATWSDMDGSSTRELFGFVNATSSLSNRWTGTVAGRIGIAFETLLYYGKFGVAFADNEYTVRAAIPGFGFNYASTASETEVGWMVGAGIEWAFAGNWSAKIEGNYMDFGRRNHTFAGIPFGHVVLPVAADFDTRVGNIKFGINYRF